MPDRLSALLASTHLNGIDFVEIASPDQRTLRVHFLNTVAVAGSLVPNDPVTITGGEATPTVPVSPITAADWGVDDAGHPLLTLHTPFPGDFSTYQLTISTDPTKLDPYYASVRFTFKAGCPSNLDCAPLCGCTPIPADTTDIDYLAKDFDSFRNALLDYSACTYPAWVERDEPDVGMMLVELLSAVGDDLSYLQDRIAAESSLATATERVSVLRHARLVDYAPRPATSATALVQLDVASATVASGIAVESPLPDGGALSFELGPGLLDAGTGALHTGGLRVDPRWNRIDHSRVPSDPQYYRIQPYLWDDAQRCLQAGATQLWVSGHGFGFADPLLGTMDLAILIDTAAATPADAPTREVVHLTAAVEEIDPLFQTEVTHLQWGASEALRFDHPLERTVLAANLVGAVQGARFTETFVIDPDPDSPDAPLAAVTRTGPDAACGQAAPVYLHTLAAGRLAWLAADDAVTPEIFVQQRPAGISDAPTTWQWRQCLLDANTFENAYTVDPVGYRDIRPPGPGVAPWWEYDGAAGDSIRFGTGAFGARPVAGTTFDVTYRVTAGAAGNVAADSISNVPPPLRGVILAATNPFAATGGADEETLDSVRANAPRAFRARQFRAVLAPDYTAAAEELPWVLDAGTAMRWTGSWLTVFTTAEPRGGGAPTLDDATTLIRLLDRRRIAGYEVYSPDPRYVGLDLIVTVCADSGAFRGEVSAAVATRLGRGSLPDGSPAFFAPGRFRFGTPLERSELEAAIQRAPGVDGVVDIAYRRRDYAPEFVPMPATVTVGAEQIIRVDNDPSLPDHGSVRIVVEGGK